MSFSASLSNTGTLAGSGTVVLPRSGFTNEGVIAPGVGGVGSLDIVGDLMLGSGSDLQFELASLGSFDTLALDGDITVGGELSIWNLGYTPTIGDSFVIMTFDQSIDGLVFDNVSWNGFGAGVVFDVLYNADNITLVAAVPEPAEYAMMLAGLALVGTIARRRRAMARGANAG
ncbi:MAG: PEP-CTERM sorting domain-containing protein [Rhodocyclaceae bacterium]|nr:PEP-CTERM sorting domain-containing protein [Rhodocyclaceae bacterium]